MSAARLKTSHANARRLFRWSRRHRLVLQQAARMRETSRKSPVQRRPSVSSAIPLLLLPVLWFPSQPWLWPRRVCLSDRFGWLGFLGSIKGQLLLLNTSLFSTKQNSSHHSSTCIKSVLRRLVDKCSALSSLNFTPACLTPVRQSCPTIQSTTANPDAALC